MSTKVVKQNSTADDAVRLVIETAWAFRNSRAVNYLLDQLPYSPRLSWFENMFWLIDKLTEYKFDEPNREQVKTPDRFLLNDRNGDCDDYSTLWLALMYRVGVKAFPKIVNYNEDDTWDHIYVIVPQKDKKKPLILDNVYGKYYYKFNVEVSHMKSKVFETKKRKFYGTF
jgi:hypothetical protein